MQIQPYVRYHYGRQDLPGAPNEPVCLLISELSGVPRSQPFLYHELEGIVRRLRRLKLDASVVQRAIDNWPYRRVVTARRRSFCNCPAEPGEPCPLTAADCYARMES